MKCDKIQELILTDYIDGQLDSSAKQDIETHLRECSKCREFLLAAEKTTIPFNELDKVRAPEHIWQAIKSAIEQKRQPFVSNVVVDFVRNIKSFIILPKPRLAIISALVMIVLATVIAGQNLSNKTMIIDDYLSEQVLFLESLNQGAINGDSEDYLNLGTSIEEFFL